MIFFQEFGGRLDPETLTQFVDAGGNVLVAGSNVIGDAVREFAGECGIEFADDKNAVIDHLNFDVNDDGQVKTMISILKEKKMICSIFSIH